MEKETSRVEAFSDGVFAVAITLLAVELGVEIKNIEAHHALKETTNAELSDLLVLLWPKFFTYFNSFASVLLMWITHHEIFKLIRKTNIRLLLTNGLLLLFVALVPFPTKTMGEFIFTNALKTAVLFYTGYAVIVAASYVLFMSTVKSRRENLLISNVSWPRINDLTRAVWLGLTLNTAIWILALFLPVVALILNFCMWAFWALISSDQTKKHAHTTHL